MNGHLTGEQRAMLLTEALHTLVVVVVIASATAVYLFHSYGLPQDLLGIVYGGSLTYAGAQVATGRAILRRHGDPSVTHGAPS